MDLTIRPVGAPDLAATRAVVKAAFRPEDVATFLDRLRADGCLIGEWLAEDASGICGHIAYSRVWIEKPDGERVKAAILTPLAVGPDRQRRGVGMRLIRHSLAKLEGRGETLFFVLGHPAYYPRAGFRSEIAQAVDSPWRGEPAFMARGAPCEGRLLLPAAIADAH